MKKKLFGWLMALVWIASSCGSDISETNKTQAEEATLSLSEFGLEATIDIPNAEVVELENEAKYEQKLLPNKRLEIKADEEILLVITECKENGVEMKVEFAEGFGETIVEKGADFCIIEQEGENGPVYDVSLFIQKDDAFIEVKVFDPESKAQCSSIETAKKGLELARTFKFA